MSPPHLASLNLNALVALDALLSECNVTRAAKRVNITQPAMSQALARLRELFDDPLLVRKGRGMIRTPRAEAMLTPLSEALQSVERAVQLGLGFDPATSKRIFRIAMTDLHLTAILPGALEALERRAPEIRIQADTMTLHGGGLSERIASGEIDLAVGFLLSSTEGLRTETLLVDEYVCIVRRGHPLARKKRVKVEEYADHRHVANTPVGFMPRALSGTGLSTQSRIRASVPYILAVPAVVKSTDLVATLPRRALGPPIDLEGLVVLEAPREFPSVAHSMWWHPRFDRDPAHQWLRALVREQFA